MKEASKEVYVVASNKWPKPFEKMSEFLVRDKREKAGRFIDDVGRSSTQTSFLLDKMRQSTAISSSILRSKRKFPEIHEKSVDQLRMTAQAGSM